MSFIIELLDYVEANTSLTTDVDLFLGIDVLDAPDKSVVISEPPGGTENQSELIMQPVQILVKDLAYVNAQILAWTIFNLLSHKPGFDTVSKVFYCEPISIPHLIDRSERGGCIFSMNFLVRRED